MIDPVLLEVPLLPDLLNSLVGMKAEKIICFNPGSESALADWIVVCEAQTSTHARAIASTLRDFCKQELGMLPDHEEGTAAARWVLLDYDNVVVNIMLPELRAHYQLEDIWADCPTVTVG